MQESGGNLVERLYIRADANQTIATGHLMRCLSIADAMKKGGVDTVFITADCDGSNLISTRGYHQIVLESCWSNMEQELPQLKKLIQQEHIEMLLVDSYYVTPLYMEELKRETTIVYIDDLPDYDRVTTYPCHVLVNYSAYADTFPYAENYGNTKLLLGCAYTPLREQFSNIPPHTISDSVTEALVMTGGTDNFHMGEQIIQRLTNLYPNIHFILISGGMNKALPTLQKLTEKIPNFSLLVNVSNLSDYMQKADIAITAGGTTLYELCACGAPSISFSFADNQLRNVHAFDRKKAIPYAGDLRDMSSEAEKTYAKLEEIFSDFVKNKNMREEYSRKMQSIVTTSTTERLAHELIQYLTN